MRVFAFILFAALLAPQVHAAGLPNVPRLPTSSGGKMGFKGSVGAGFTDFNVISPNTDFKLDRGMYIGGTIERGFNVLNLYLSLGLSYMNAQGTSNYTYTDLSQSTTYQATDVAFTATLYELSLGLKLKLIDDYWFKPYIEGGGIGSYNTVAYDQASLQTLSALGSDYKRKDVIMGSGYYAEAGLELEFAASFGVKIGARQSTVETKKLDTLGVRPLLIQSQTFYFSGIFGF